MADEARLLEDPEFQEFLRQKNRWRWGFSGFLILTYIVYAIAGIYFGEAYAKPVFGTSIPFGMAVGDLIIAFSIVLSLVYVRIVNRLEDETVREQERHQ